MTLLSTKNTTENPVTPEMDTYSPEEIGSRLSVDAHTVRIWLERGLLEGIRENGDWCIPKRALLKLLIP